MAPSISSLSLTLSSTASLMSLFICWFFSVSRPSFSQTLSGFWLFLSLSPFPLSPHSLSRSLTFILSFWSFISLCSASLYLLPYRKISRKISGENSDEISRDISRQNLMWNSDPRAARIPLKNADDEVSVNQKSSTRLRHPQISTKIYILKRFSHF